MSCNSSSPLSITVILNTEEVPNHSIWGEKAKKLIEDWNHNVLTLLGISPTLNGDTVFLTLRNMDEGIAWTDGKKHLQSWVFLKVR